MNFILRPIKIALMRSRLYAWFLRAIIPYIRFTTYYPKIRGSAYHAGYARLRAGDIILTVDRRKLTTLLIGGEWAHAALCVRDSGVPYEVAEMTHTDYTKSHFFDLCKEADRVMILRCTDFDETYVARVVSRCLGFEGAKYDQQFTLGVEQLYCSELVYEADFERRLKIDLSDLAGLGRQYISPTGLRNAKNCVVIFDSDSY